MLLGAPGIATRSKDATIASHCAQPEHTFMGAASWRKPAPDDKQVTPTTTVSSLEVSEETCWRVLERR